MPILFYITFTLFSIAFLIGFLTALFFMKSLTKKDVETHKLDVYDWHITLREDFINTLNLHLNDFKTHIVNDLMLAQQQAEEANLNNMLNVGENIEEADLVDNSLNCDDINDEEDGGDGFLH